MKLSYYPGCSLHSTAVEYDLSTRAVCGALDLELQEVPDWNCCGASSGHATNDFLAQALPLRNLILAEQQGHDVMVPCAACYNLLQQAEYGVRHQDPHTQDANQELSQIMGKQYTASIRVRHLLDILSSEAVLTTIKNLVQTPLQGLRLAAYYGCLLTRPPAAVAFEANPEQPRTMDKILQTLGAEPVQWTHRTECCGASLSISRPELVINLTSQIAAAAQHGGAQALVAACPLCHSNLDTRQGKESNQMPVFFISELVGLALNVAGGSQWLHKHMVDPMPLLRSLNLPTAS